MRRTVWIVLGCLSLGGCVTNTLETHDAQLVAASAASPARAPVPAPAPTLTPTARLANAKLITITKVTTAGATLILASPQSLAPDCSPLGQVGAKIVTPPDHGTISIQNGLAFSTYTPGDPPYLCNARKSPATLLTYRSSAGFSGQDTASVQIFFPDGRAPTVLFHIDVQ